MKTMMRKLRRNKYLLSKFLSFFFFSCLYRWVKNSTIRPLLCMLYRSTILAINCHFMSTRFSAYLRGTAVAPNINAVSLTRKNHRYVFMYQCKNESSRQRNLLGSHNHRTPNWHTTSYFLRCLGKLAKPSKHNWVYIPFDVNDTYIQLGSVDGRDAPFDGVSAEVKRSTSCGGLAPRNTQFSDSRIGLVFDDSIQWRRRLLNKLAICDLELSCTGVWAHDSTGGYPGSDRLEIVVEIWVLLPSIQDKKNLMTETHTTDRMKELPGRRVEVVPGAEAVVVELTVVIEPEVVVVVGAPPGRHCE